MAIDFIFEPLPPSEAVTALTARTTAAGFMFDWRDAQPEEHLASFYVAKMMRKDLLELVHGRLVIAQAQGWTQKQFIDSIQDELRAEGWWGRQEMVDPVAGETQLVQLGSVRRLRTIYYTNMRQSFQAGLWQRIQDSKALLPFLRYQTMPDEKVRAQHQAWHDIVLPIDHPFWLTHFPMNGWGCRCYVTQMTAGMVKRAGDKRKRAGLQDGQAPTSS
jgi:uncharacterized protein with gpF-like domain